MNPVIERVAEKEVHPISFRGELTPADSIGGHVSPAGQAGSSREELYYLALHGDVDAFTRLIQPYERAIYLVALAFARCREAAEEIAFRAIYRAYAVLEEVKSLPSLPRWLMRVAVSAARDYVGFEQNDSSSEDRAPRDLQADALPSRQIGCSTRERLTGALLALSQRERAVILLRDTLHFTSAEIAEILDLPLRSIKESLSCARFGVLERLAASAGL